MSAILPINVDDLLHQRTVESERVEFKGAWDTHRTGPQVIRTICGFANDYHNLNGGYVVIGVDEEGGRSVLPPRGLSASDLDAAQRWIRGQCNRLDPAYPPVLSPELVDDKLVLVIWAPASEMRPHRAPARDGTMRYWVRLGSETVDAEQRGGLLQRLVEQTAKVPWDDRRAADARVEDLRETKVREYLRDVGSGLVDASAALDIYRRMRITTKVNDHEVPRNVGLLCFSGNPERWFRGASIEVVQFDADRPADVLEERTFRGPLLDQLADSLRFLENQISHHIEKQPNRVQARTWVSYPMEAVREALVNAAYHRGYDVDQPEPTKVYIYPSRMDIISYPGPVGGIERHHLLPAARPHAVPARNRRIGEFLKDLRLAEGRLTGIRKIFDAMKANGSPAPQFEFDEGRTFFQAVLPAHPEYAAILAMADASRLRAIGEQAEALRRLETAWEAARDSVPLATEMIRVYLADGSVEEAEGVYHAFVEAGQPDAALQMHDVLVAALEDAGYFVRAHEVARWPWPR